MAGQVESRRSEGFKREKRSVETSGGREGKSRGGGTEEVGCATCERSD
jgi:hypothetical protein